MTVQQEELRAQPGVDPRPAVIPAGAVDQLHPEWAMGGGFALRAGRSTTRRPVALKEIAALILYLRCAGDVAEADRIRAETKRLCAIARSLGYGRLDGHNGGKRASRGQH